MRRLRGAFDSPAMRAAVETPFAASFSDKVRQALALNGRAPRAQETEELKRWHDAAHSAFLRDVAATKAGPPLLANADLQFSYPATLKQALSLVDVRTLDHIIVAGSQTISF